MTDNGWAAALLAALLAAQRLLELRVAGRQGQQLQEAGRREVAPGQMPWFLLLHTGFFLSLVLELYLQGPRIGTTGRVAAVFFILAQGLRVWSRHSLGAGWNTRIYVGQDMALVHRGPYRWIRHPNYLAVILEIASFPMIFQAWRTALLFSVLNAALLLRRIRAEEAALRAAASPESRAVFDRLPRFFPRWTSRPQK